MGRDTLIELAWRDGFSRGRDNTGFYGPKGADWLDVENIEWESFKKFLDKFPKD